MSMSEEEISRRSEEIFGTPISGEHLSGLASLLASLEGTHLRAVEAIAPESEPMGHRAILRESRHGG